MCPNFQKSLKSALSYDKNLYGREAIFLATMSSESNSMPLHLFPAPALLPQFYQYICIVSQEQD